ncbi:hypothetical protein G6F59_017286 [Rhizopus arrhizus]|nr:hypothetical protein G6F59_017286 [Rhizopus arrhizus]
MAHPPGQARDPLYATSHEGLSRSLPTQHPARAADPPSRHRSSAHDGAARSGTGLRGRDATRPARRAGSHRAGAAQDCRPAPDAPGPAARGAAWRNRNRSRYRRSPPGTAHHPIPAVR